MVDLVLNNYFAFGSEDFEDEDSKKDQFEFANVKKILFYEFYKT
jgi:hypothetical protein